MGGGRKVSRWLAFAAIVFIFRGAASAGLPANAGLEVQHSLLDYQKYFAEQQYLEASESAKMALAFLLRDPGYDRMAYGQVLVFLADAQYYAGLYGPATQNYEMAIEVIQSARDRLDSDLVAPFLGLSRALLATHQYPEAIRNYQHSLHVRQVNTGLYNEQVAEIAAELSEAYFTANDFEQAKRVQDFYVATVERVYPGDNLARLPSMYSRADMLSRTGNNSHSHNAYRQIISLVERADGRESLLLVPALTAAADLLGSNRIVDGYNGTEKAKRYLRKAIAITERNVAASIPSKADAHINMGDFLCARTANRNSAIRSYQRAWAYLDGDPQYHQRRDELFGHALLLDPVPPGTPSAMLSLLANSGNPDTVKNGVILVRYDVGQDGRPENVRVVESTPPGLHDYIVLNHVRSFAFRPRFQEGEPIRSTDLTFERQFSYSDEELSASLQEK